MNHAENSGHFSGVFFCSFLTANLLIPFLTLLGVNGLMCVSISEKVFPP